MPDFSSAQLLSAMYHMLQKGPHINKVWGKNSRTGSCIESFYFPLETFSLFDSAYEKLYLLYNSNG